MARNPNGPIGPRLNRGVDVPGNYGFRHGRASGLRTIRLYSLFRKLDSGEWERVGITKHRFNIAVEKWYEQLRESQVNPNAPQYCLREIPHD